VYWPGFISDVEFPRSSVIFVLHEDR